MNNNINIVFASDNLYVPYMGISIQSIIMNSNQDINYFIYILDNGISENNRKRLRTLEKDNVKLHFIDMNDYLKNIDTSMFYIYPPYTISTYLRFFLPKIFPELDRILYIDSDTVIEKDVADLFNCKLDNKYLAAVEDFEVKRIIYADSTIKDYLHNTLQLQNIDSYFQAGVLLFNLNLMRTINFTEKCFEILKKIQKPMFVDQCVLNAVCAKFYKKLDPSWNVEWHLSFQPSNLKENLKPIDYSRYFESFNNPFIIHYTSRVKPWNTPDIPLADRFWYYARQSVFYEEILYKNMLDITGKDIDSKISSMPIKAKIKDFLKTRLHKK